MACGSTQSKRLNCAPRARNVEGVFRFGTGASYSPLSYASHP